MRPPPNTHSATVRKRKNRDGHHLRHCRCGRSICDCSRPITVSTKAERDIRGPSDYYYRNMQRLRQETAEDVM